MAIPRGLGSFDPTITTRFGPTGTEEIDALNRGIQLGMREGNEIARLGYMRRREKRDIQAAKELSDVRAAQRYKIHSEQKEGLFFQPTKNIDGINAARAEVSTMLVDKANQLFQEREKGNLSAVEYAKGMAFLEGQIPLYKTAEETIRVNAEKYLEGVANGTLSNINDPKVESWWGAVADGTASLRYATTKDGQIVITGEWDDPTDDIKGKVQVPLADIEKMAVVKYQPKEDVQTFRKASTDSMVKAKVSNSIANGASKQQLLSEIDNLKITKDEKSGKYNDTNVTTVFANNFDEYLEGLGDGDEVDQVAQYIMDGGPNNYYRSQNVLENVIQNVTKYGDKIDQNQRKKFEEMSTKEDLEELIKLGHLEDVKEALKQDYINSSVNEYNFQLEEQLTGAKRKERKERRDELKIQSDIKTLEDAKSDEKTFSKFQNNLLNIRKGFNSWKGKKREDFEFGPRGDANKTAFDRGENAQIEYLRNEYGKQDVTFKEEVIENPWYKSAEGKATMKNADLEDLKDIKEKNPPTISTGNYNVFHAGKLVGSTPKKNLFTQKFDKFLIRNIPKSRTTETAFDVTNLDEDAYKKDADKDLKVF